MSFLLVVKAELVRSFIIMRRYWFATLTSMIVGYGMLLGLIVGFMSRREEMVGAVQNRFGVDPEQAVNAALGLIIGMFAFGIVGLFSQGLQALARSGQLEQLCLSPHGLVTNFLGRSMVGAVSSVVTSSVLLLLISQTVQGTVHLRPFETVVLLVLTYFDLIGFGFMVGGLVLLFKQTGQVAVIVRMALLALAVTVSDTIDTGYKILDWLAHAAPITDAAICFKHVLVRNSMVEIPGAEGAEPILEYVSLFAFGPFYFLVLNSIFWTIVGITVFRIMENYSRDKGTLGTY